MEVYCLFETVGDGDTGERHDKLLGVFDSCESARLRAVSLSSVDQELASWWYINDMNEMNDLMTKEEISIYYTKYDYPLHRTMNKVNNYIYIGKRSDCNAYHGYNAFGGYIIEPVVVESVVK